MQTVALPQNAPKHLSARVSSLMSHPKHAQSLACFARKTSEKYDPFLPLGAANEFVSVEGAVRRRSSANCMRSVAAAFLCFA